MTHRVYCTLMSPSTMVASEMIDLLIDGHCRSR